MVQPIENLPVDGYVLIDYNFLQNYSDYLGYWISQFDLAIHFISLPTFASVIGYTIVTKLYPVEVPYLKFQIFARVLASIPVGYKIESKL